VVFATFAQPASSSRSILPEPIEAVGAQFGIPHRVLDVTVAQEVLQRAGVDAVIGKLEAAGVVQHVRMSVLRKAVNAPGPKMESPKHSPRSQGAERRKTGDQISPPGGYVGGGIQMQTDLAISPSGDVWVMNNWQDIDSCFGNAKEALSTRCGGQGVTVF